MIRTQRGGLQWLAPDSLRARILLLMVLVALPGIASVVGSTLRERAHAIAMAQAQLSMRVRYVLARESEATLVARQFLVGIANLPALRGGDRDLCAERMAQLLSGGGMFVNLSLYDGNGLLVCSAGVDTGFRIGEPSMRALFQRALTTPELSIGDYRPGMAGNPGFLDYALMLPAQGRVSGVLVASYPLLLALQAPAEPGAETPPADTAVMLVSPDGLVAAQSPAVGAVGTRLPDAGLYTSLTQPSADADGTAVRVVAGADRRSYALAAVRRASGEVRGYLAASIPDAALLAPLNQRLARDLGVITLILSAIGLVAVTGSEVLVVRRVKSLLTVTHRITAGDLGARTPVFEKRGELAVLEIAFNDMADHVQAQVDSINALNRTYAMLTAINAAIFHIRDRDALIGEACRIAVEVGGYCAACIYLADADATQARPVAHMGRCESAFAGSVVDLEQLTARRGDPVSGLLDAVVAEARGGQALVPATHGAEPCSGCGAEMVFALCVAGRAIGALALISSAAAAFTDTAELELLRQLAADTALGLDTIQKEQRIARLTRVQAVLSEINGALLRTQRAGDIADDTCRIAVQTGGFVAACMIRLDPHGAKAYVAGHAGAAPAYFDAMAANLASADASDVSPLCAALRTGNHCIEQDSVPAGIRRFDPVLVACGVGAVAAFPLRSEGQVAGALLLWSATTHAFDDEEVVLLRQLVADAGLGLDHIGQRALVYRLSNFDRLTGLPNRSLFEDRAAQTLSRAPRLRRVAAVLSIRVAGLRKTNSEFGLAGGDQMLTQVAAYLNQAVRPGDTVARLGDNEFGVLLAEVASVEEASVIAGQIISECPREVRLADKRIATGVSMGVSIFPLDGADIATLIRNAELALSHSQASPRRNFAFYSATLDQQARQRHHMETELSGAIERNELSLVYQPVVRIADRAIIGAETLLRWDSRSLGPVSPSVFVPLAEQSGMIEAIGSWVVRSAFSQHVAWSARIGGDFRLSVNVSPRQLRSLDFLEVVRQHLQQTGLDPRRSLLCIEITESELMDDIDASLQVLNRLKSLGMHVSIDDFGTGYSSLSYIRRLPVDNVKIDTSFVREIATNANAKGLVASIVAMAHSLDLAVVAEGVETQTQFDVLAEMGCDAAQGYLFSRPVPAAQFEQLLADAGRDRDALNTLQ
ncbi:MAG: hypothetical protein CVV14_02325 [Gammaproteobacteria bacterium HGW-Gammaproteobacteria-4]|jgi:diguanylate cyclase (GGDEF)-like protein|nr:MAG: hypothetical protein CVV14_02325 [Gammaproteobacteria bacterium HGW-Gammaproteobacteria-4]